MKLSAAAPLRHSAMLCLFLGVHGLGICAGQSRVQPRIVQPIDESVLTVLKGNTHRLALPRYDRGEAPADLPMERMLLVLKRSPEQQSALDMLLEDQQDGNSPKYHKWLTPEQFGKQFGPADQDIKTVTGWLRSHGFSIGSVAQGRTMIEFSGSAAQVKETFHTAIHKFVVDGAEHWANASDPQIPTALTPVVAGVHTLHNFLKKPMLQFKGEKLAARLVGEPPQVTFNSNPPVHALGPADFAKIYHNTLETGGRLIAVVGRSNLWKGGADPREFGNIFRIPVYVDVTLNGPDPGDLGGGEEVEATLDVTWASAANPFVDEVTLVVSATTNTTDGVDLSELYIIDNDMSPVMTESFGSCELAYTSAAAQGVSALAEQAAAEGITYIVSSGDSGAEGCDNANAEEVAHYPVSVNILASTPYTVAVGGTEFNEDGHDNQYWSSQNGVGYESAKSYIPENVWNESCTVDQCGSSANIAAGGGGASIFFDKPSWQVGVRGIPNDGKRDVPDVSLSASSHDAYLVCLEDSCVPDANGNFFIYLVGGTSASAPAFAGIMSMVVRETGSAQGQANHVLYRLAATETFTKCNGSNTSKLPGSTCIFNDVTVGNNAVPGEQNYGKPGAQYQSTVGYDLATGLGSVNIANLVQKWTSIKFTPTTTTIVNLTPTTITHGQAVSADITVAGSGGTPTGSVAIITSYGQGVGPFPLTSGEYSGPINALPGGQYNVWASYGGDHTFGASISSPSALLKVNPEGSNTALAVLGPPDKNGHYSPFVSGPYGSFVHFWANVGSQSGYGIPTGTVNFMDGAGLVGGGPYNLNSEGSTGTPYGYYKFVAGAHSVTANYLGDRSFNSSTSSPVGFSITKASTSTTIELNGLDLIATVKTNSGGEPPTGYVKFYVDGAEQNGGNLTQTQSPVVNRFTGEVISGASAAADIKIGRLPSKGFKGVYGGDANYTGSTSGGTKDFSLDSNTSNFVLTAGEKGSLAVNVIDIDGFLGSVTFNCTGLPTGASCSFSPATVTGSSETTLTIKTTAPTAALLAPGQRRVLATSISLVGALFGGLLLLVAPDRRRRKALLLTLCLFLVALPGCGGGSSSSNNTHSTQDATPRGTYKITVQGVSGNLSHNLSVTMKVQ